MSLEPQIRAALEAAFQPSLLEIVNESNLHAGHNPEAAATHDTHYRIRISASSFAGKSRVSQHREINAALKFAFDAGLHALAIEVKSGN
ncbi:MAG: BolA family transcriptional regulator [Rhizobiaceae bacterium]|nr:BolA family transcriptional regulator [Rhizobiaceae bacterium]